MAPPNGTSLSRHWFSVQRRSRLVHLASVSEESRRPVVASIYRAFTLNPTIVGIFESKAHYLRGLGRAFLFPNTSPLYSTPDRASAFFLAPSASRDVECSMSEAEEYLQNAQVCAACAEIAKAESDRSIWLRMSEAWRDLARIAERRASTVHPGEAAAA